MMDWSPFWISLKVSGWSTLFAIAVGLPIAFGIARRQFPGRTAIVGMTNLPLVIPPTFLGFAILVVLGDRSPVSQFKQHKNNNPLGLTFTWHGAVVAAGGAS